MKTISLLNLETAYSNNEIFQKIVPISSALVNRFDDEAIEQKNQFETFSKSIGKLFHKPE